MSKKRLTSGEKKHMIIPVNRFFDIILQKFYIFEICPDLFEILPVDFFVPVKILAVVFADCDAWNDGDFWLFGQIFHIRVVNDSFYHSFSVCHTVLLSAVGSK